MAPGPSIGSNFPILDRRFLLTVVSCLAILTFPCLAKADDPNIKCCGCSVSKGSKNITVCLQTAETCDTAQAAAQGLVGTSYNFSGCAPFSDQKCARLGTTATAQCSNAPAMATGLTTSILDDLFGTTAAASASASASAVSSKPTVYTTPQLNIPIPGLAFSPVYEEQNVIYVPFLAQYIVGMQKMLIGIALVVAAMMLVYAGALYIFSGTGAHIQDAKEIISDALIGLGIILGAYVILANINPNTTNMTPLMVPKISKETFDYNTGYDPSNTTSAEDVDCGSDCPSMKDPSGKGSATRMKAACKGGGTTDALKDVIQAWVKEAIPSGSGYIRGGAGFGKDMKLASPYAGYLFCHLAEKGWLSDETKAACQLPDGFTFDTNRVSGHCSSGEHIRTTHPDFKDSQALIDAEKQNNKGPCYAALKKDYMTFFVCPMKCNDLFGADCSGFIGAIMPCAGIKHRAADVLRTQGQARAECKTKQIPWAGPEFYTCKMKGKYEYTSIKDDQCNPASPDRSPDCDCNQISKAYYACSVSDFVTNILPILPAGSTMELSCGAMPIPHMFLYTGKMGLPFELMESGGPRTPTGGNATFINWHGQSEFTVSGGLSTTASLSDYLNGMCSGGVNYIYAVADL